MPIVEWIIKNDQGEGSFGAYPASPPIVTIRNADGTYQAIYEGNTVTDIIVAFCVEADEEIPHTYQFSLIFKTEDFEPDTLLIDEARCENLGAVPVLDAKCKWTIQNGSATAYGTITVDVFNHNVEGGQVKWTLDSDSGSPGAALSLKVKRQDTGIS